MAKYEVSVYVSGTVYVEVDADSYEDAMSEADNVVYGRFMDQMMIGTVEPTDAKEV